MVLRYKDIHVFDNYKTVTVIYRMHGADEVSVHRACCEPATKPFSPAGGGMVYPGSRQTSVTTHSPRMVTECLPTRSMLIKMYIPFHVYVQCIYSQSISCRRSLLFSLSNCIYVLSIDAFSKTRMLTFCGLTYTQHVNILI